jgi:hypothetical protein
MTAADGQWSAAPQAERSIPMTTYDTTLEIDAPASQVWSVLIDFPHYPEWNSAVTSLAGEARVGSILSVRLDMSGKPMDVKAEVQEFEPETRFSWRGHLGAEFLFTGIRAFTVESLQTGATRFRHYEAIRGLLVPPFLLFKGKALAAHHHGFNRSIKQRAETLASQQR